MRSAAVDAHSLTRRREARQGDTSTSARSSDRPPASLDLPAPPDREPVNDGRTFSLRPVNVYEYTRKRPLPRSGSGPSRPSTELARHPFGSEIQYLAILWFTGTLLPIPSAGARCARLRLVPQAQHRVRLITSRTPSRRSRSFSRVLPRGTLDVALSPCAPSALACL